ncbi:type II secretion system protein [Colwelliaceae bacterium 6441]
MTVYRKGVRKYAQGFTLIELIVTIIILGIMAATIAPRFFTSNGFEEYAYRTEVVATLRAVQLRAMQQTDSTQCHKVKTSADGKIFGLLATDNSSDNCDEGQWFDEVNGKYDLSKEDGSTSVQVDSEHSVSFGGNDFSFDQMGRPDLISCGSPCIVTINGAENLTIKIEAEGYIHAL